MRREWVHETLTSAESITDLFDTRIYQGESLDGPPKAKKPFLVHRLGNSSPDDRVHTARRQYLTIYIHDPAKPGDYTKIDEGVDAVIAVMRAAPPSPEDHLIEARWLETSADFDDREMGTILRYVRFHLILSQWTQ